MPTTVNNEASTLYQFEGSTETQSAVSNQNTVTLQDSQGLTLTKTASPTILSPGAIITYTVVITNSSPSFLNGVRIIDDLGGGNLAYVIGSAKLSAGGTTYPVNPIATSPLTFTLQQLGVGGTMTLTYKAQVIFNLPTSINAVTNTVHGIGYTASGTINGFANETIQRQNSLGLSITKTSNESTVFPNQLLRYTITLTNNSSTSANVESVTDQLPANFVLNSATLKIGNSSVMALNESDYTLTGTNFLTVPSMSGPSIWVPAGGSTIITLNGYLN